jgi:Ca2+-binding RTX toxin-like protein
VNLAAGRLRVDFEDATTDRLVSIENVVTGTGNDTVHGNAGANRLEVGEGINVVHAGNGDDTVIGGTYTSDEISRNSWQDEIHGDRGNDLLVGNGAIFVDQTDGYRPSGQDYLAGGAGDDTLVGGTHRTVMEGGEGADHFQSSNEVFEYYDFEGGEVRAMNAPQILDFDPAEGDRLVISIAENPNGATPTFVGQVADLDALDDFEFGYAVDGQDVIARFVTRREDWPADDLDIRLAGYDGGLLAADVIFV